MIVFFLFIIIRSSLEMQIIPHSTNARPIDDYDVKEFFFNACLVFIHWLTFFSLSLSLSKSSKYAPTGFLEFNI